MKKLIYTCIALAIIFIFCAAYYRTKEYNDPYVVPTPTEVVSEPTPFNYQPVPCYEGDIQVECKG